MTATPRCEGCHRRLKQPSPSGYGPKCARKLAQSSQDGRTAPQGPGVPSRRSQALTATSVPACDGQLAIPTEGTSQKWATH